ncbi:unnamed protein product [Gongylonema pulchrum]|uniref:Chloride channel CLIC-like protein 1 n=1 Tax=Gongylonema pulchrum TaxID=637853 RepID=A0A183DYZ8_9BILA|nr:unnamed protein product [Gongylonema pulchrum]
MISDVLGLLFGQIAVLAMLRLFKTMPRQWFREHIHPAIRWVLRCGMPNCASRNIRNLKANSASHSNVEKDDGEAKAIVKTIEKALLNLRNYDLQLLHFEETFIGSLVTLMVIFCILFTLGLWLRRLFYLLSNVTNYVNFELCDKEV